MLIIQMIKKELLAGLRSSCRKWQEEYKGKVSD